MDIYSILRGLQNVKKSGSGWTARCPAHDDQKNSLSIGEGDKGLMLYCHAGCSFEHVRTALGTIEETTQGNRQPQIKRRMTTTMNMAFCCIRMLGTNQKDFTSADQTEAVDGLTICRVCDAFLTGSQNY